MTGAQKPHTHRHVLRFVLEAKTPLSIGTGLGAGLFDTALVRDGNGLPTVPGTSLAGVLLALWRRVYDEKSALALFGWEKERDQAGQASRLEISFGHIHGSCDRAVEGLLTGPEGEAKRGDFLLAHALKEAPVKRDHVKLSDRLAADDKAKFDRTSLPAGYRFSFEIGLWGRGYAVSKDKAAFKALLALMTRPDFRLGGATRRGLGRMALVHAHYRVFDLREEIGRKAFADYRALPIDDVADFEKIEVHEPEAVEGNGSRPISLTLKLKPEGFWRFGQGQKQLSPLEGEKEADAVPTVENRVVWEHGRGSFEECLVVPGSAVKGPIAHRAEFHYRCATLSWNGKVAGNGRFMDEFLGVTKASEGAEKGHAGCIFVDDVYLPIEKDGNGGVMNHKLCLVTHNTIDRFTQGVMNHRLFTEEVLYKGAFEIPIHVLPRRLDGGKVCEKKRQAFHQALLDLCKGRLALGADDHGYCTGTIDGETVDGETALDRWVNGKNAEAGDDRDAA